MSRVVIDNSLLLEKLEMYENNYRRLETRVKDLSKDNERLNRLVTFMDRDIQNMRVALAERDEEIKRLTDANSV